MLRDQRFGNGALALMEDFGITHGQVHDFRAQSIIMASGPRHLRLRTPLARFMGPVTVEGIRHEVRSIIADIAGGLDTTGPVDFHHDVDERIPPGSTATSPVPRSRTPRWWPACPGARCRCSTATAA